MQALDRIDVSNNWFTLVFVFVLLLLVVLKTMDQSKLLGYTSAFFVKGFVMKKTEERVSFFHKFSVVLLCFSAIVYALFCTLMAGLFFKVTPDFLFFLYSVLGVFIYVIVFLLLDVGLSKLCDAQEKTSYLFATKIAYLHSISILIFPVLIVVYYSGLSPVVLFWIFIMLFSLSLFLTFVNNKNLILNKLFYFILYLCALEIAPLLILYKTMV